MFYEALSGILGIGTLVFLGLFQFLGIFLTGLSFYYFIGNPDAGKKIISNISRVGVRIYAHAWMLLMGVVSMLGFSYVVKAFFGLFGEFAYTLPRRATVNLAAENDLKMGLTLLVVGLFVLAIHRGFLFFAEKGLKISSTITSKLAFGIGLFLHSLVIFTALFVFVFSLLNGSTPGASLAYIIGAAPFWGYYAFKSLRAFKSE